MKGRIFLEFNNTEINPMKYKQFSDIKAGCSFLLADESPCVKIESGSFHNERHDKKVNAVCIGTGELLFINDKVVVSVV